MIEGSYIVVYKGSVASVSAETRARERELGFSSRHRFRRSLEGFSAKLRPDQVRRLRSDPDVDYVSENRTVHAVGGRSAGGRGLGPGRRAPHPRRHGHDGP